MIGVFGVALVALLSHFLLEGTAIDLGAGSLLPAAGVAAVALGLGLRSSTRLPRSSEAVVRIRTAFAY